MFFFSSQNYYVPDTLFGQFEVPLIRYISKLESGYNRLMVRFHFFLYIICNFDAFFFQQNKIGTTFTPTQHNSELNMSVCLVAANAHPNSIPWFPQTFLGVQQQGSFSMPKQNAPLIPQGQNPYMNVAPVMPEPTYQQHHEMKQSQRNSIPPNAFSYTPNQSISQNVSVIPPQFQTQQSAHNPQYFHGMNQQQFETQQNQQQQSSFSNLYPTLEQNQFSPVNPSFK